MQKGKKVSKQVVLLSDFTAFKEREQFKYNGRGVRGVNCDHNNMNCLISKLFGSRNARLGFHLDRKSLTCLKLLCGFYLLLKCSGQSAPVFVPLFSQKRFFFDVMLVGNFCCHYSSLHVNEMISLELQARKQVDEIYKCTI